MIKLRCPKCDSSRYIADGDMVAADIEGYYEAFYSWWHCLDCNHIWRFDNDSLNPTEDDFKDG
ncbi:MAG: hypothetical protein DWQ19_10130 [Crenarchaeota archaeon]|nr:MAG: hypothetical protein DWQ19_10130 [Thermoproteota archaeon]